MLSEFFYIVFHGEIVLKICLSYALGKMVKSTYSGF